MNKFRQVQVIPVISAGIYAANDQLGDIMELASFEDKDNKGVLLRDISILDEATQSDAMDILFFDRTITIAADNAASIISDADMAFCIGQVKIVAGDYVLSGSTSSMASKRNIDLVLSSNEGVPVANIFAVAITRGTPTYAAVDALVFKFKGELLI